ncbi:MAG: DUF3488 and transglutaminase-like domain-containing protein, partial [Pseudohongiellaceae bacterium]
LRMPLWISVIALICILWRITIYRGKLDYPGKLMRVAVVLFTLIVSVSQIRSIGIGLESAAALLALGFVFKLIEMQTKRDVYVVISLCFVMALVAFIYSQSAVTTVYVGFCIVVVIGTMISMNRSPAIADNMSTLRLALKITAQSIPLMVVLFLVFPRIAPLWAVPMPASSNRTGVSDEMSPGAISSLGRSADLAFRVSFNGAQLPAHQDLYWRGLVLDEFDGITWSRSSNSRFFAAAARGNFNADYEGRINLIGDPVDYSVILEPTQQPWLYGLHLAEPRSSSVFRGRNFELFYSTIVTQRYGYNLRTYPEGQTDVFLLSSIRARALEIPEQGNEQSRNFARQLRSQFAGDRELANAVLAYFSQQAFFYTLTPPVLEGDQVDDFLFNTRQGFCEHYASSFTYLMRAAGIPARVVVGYQGAEYNRFEDYLMVYQYNAHAWSEIWLAGKGWVRFDPTGAVSPDRINLGVEAALQDDPAFMNDALFSMMRFRGMNLINTLRLRLDAIEYEWNRRVVSYDQEVQFELFERLFGDVTERKILILMSVMATLVLFFVALTVIRIRPDRQSRPVEKLYLKVCRELGRAGYPRLRGEGPRDYYLRIAESKPALADEFGQLTEMFMRLNYAPEISDDAARKNYLDSFRKRLVRFRLKLNPIF